MIAPDTVRFERLLPGPIDRVWAYVTDGEMRGKWLASGAWDLRVGGRAELNFKHSDLSPIREPAPAGFEEMDAKGHQAIGEVLALDPPRMVAITWEGGSEVTFELTARGEEVMLTLTHRKLTRADMLSVSGGWDAHLAVLEDQANGRTPRPFWSTWLALKGEYESRIP